ncbi:MAG: AAA family ATPase, partial [Fibrobacter sp.]|nr:AAA family ATPase [Fibrobacter sp.]
MKREILSNLLSWKQSTDRKPLLLQGARQTGKTYILKELGKTHYTNLHYFNFETEPLLHSFFEMDLNPSRIIESLSLFRKTSINADSDLIFFDEIQFSNNALNALKYFCEDAPQYHIVAAGSLLGVKLTQPRSFPVGKVSILTLYPMSFREYLDACGDTAYINYLESLNSFNQIPIAFHEALIQRLKEYYFIGGMPEVVKNFLQNRNFKIAREIQDSICKVYLYDFAKHAIP